jgi:hypothetical protein
MTSNVTRTAKQVLQSLATLDLGPIRFKLQNREEGEGWDKQTCDKVEPAYKMFLALCIAHPTKNIVPTKLVDKMWHYHILDTKKYAEDCERHLGQFLHHFPYFGMRGQEDKQELMICGQDTRLLYLQEFSYEISQLLSETSLCGPENCDPSCTNRIGDQFNWTRPTA